MNIKCGLCGKEIVVTDDLADGQHVRCPFCGGKSEYRKPTRIELPTGAECRRQGPVVPAQSDSTAAKLEIKLPEMPSEAVKKPLRVIRKEPGPTADSPSPEQQMASRRVRMAEDHVRFYEEMKDVEHRRKTREKLNGVLMLLAIALCAIGVYWYVGSRKGKDRVADSDSRAEINRLDVGQCVMRPEPKVEVAKESDEQARALDSLRNFLSREKSMVEGIVRDSSAAFDEILNDQKRMSEALIRLEAENAARSKVAQTNGWMRFDKAEMVMMILKDRDMNDLAIKYLGEDFSALRMDCRSRIRDVLDMQAETMKRLSANRARYRKQLEGIEEEVDRKASRAQEITMQANKDLESRLQDLEKMLGKKEMQLKRLTAIDRKTQWIVNEQNAVKEEIYKLEKEISRVKEVVAVSRGNVAHIAATAAETLARRKGDAALSSRQDDDNAVHSEMAHVRTIFNLALEYEGRSLDRISASMRSRKDILSARTADAQKKLDFIIQSSANADLMQPAEIENLRKRIADRIGENVMEKLQ